MDISVIIPVYNEELNLPALFARLTEVMQKLGRSYELLFINDGSRDRSIELIRDLADKHPEVRFIDLSRNFGHQIAVSAGIDYVSGDAVCIIDADLQDPPELIIDLYHKMRNEGYEVVYARRARRLGESIFKLWTAKMFYRILSNITTVPIPVDTGDFRIIDRSIVEVLRQMPEKDKYIRGQISWIGFRQTYVEYERHERNAGETGYTLRKMFRLALDGITGFSNFPLRLVTIFGFLVSVIAFLVALYALHARFFTEHYVSGWTSLIIAVLFTGGVQLLSLGIIGEYLARVNSNVRNRPLYVVRQTNVPK